MPEPTQAEALGALIAKLKAQRNEHAQAIVAIDATFERYGIRSDVRVGRGPGRPPATAAAGKRRKRRGTFKETAEQFVVGLLKSGKALVTAEINKAWKAAGRGGAANTVLSKLTQAKAITRQKVKGGQGSSYAAP